MKYYALLFSAIIPTIACAMEQTIEIRDRNLDTDQHPHITIINQLPKEDPRFSTTRIDIFDTVKINSYAKNSYRPDDSTKTIYSNQGMRFSMHLNKNGIPQHERLGLNDTRNAALIALFIHGATQNPFTYLMIGKGSKIQFGDTITIVTQSNGKVSFEHQNKPLKQLETNQEVFVGLPLRQDSKFCNEITQLLEANLYLENEYEQIIQEGLLSGKLQ